MLCDSFDTSSDIVVVRGMAFSGVLVSEVRVLRERSGEVGTQKLSQVRVFQKYDFVFDLGQEIEQILGGNSVLLSFIE